MFWSLTSSTGGVNLKETLLSSQKKAAVGSCASSQHVLWISPCCSNKDKAQPVQGSASASKNYYGCFWKSAIASAVHAKKQKLFQKSGLHEALAKCYQNLPLWPVGCNQTVDQRAWSITLSCKLMQHEILLAILNFYFGLFHHHSLLLIWLLENFLRITTFLKPGLNLFEK